MMNMAKAALTLMAIAALTGCIEVVHFVDQSGGQLEARYRLTITKSVVEFMQQLGQAGTGGDQNSGNDKDSGDDGMSAEQLEQQISQSIEQIRSALPEGMESDIRSINTEYDFGVDMRVAAGTADPERAARWVPTRSDGELSVPLFPSEEEASSSTPSGSEGRGPSGQADAAMAGRKYRLLLTDEVVPENPEFLLRTPEQTISQPVSSFTVGDVYLVEIPMSLWMEQNRVQLIVRSQE
jgi:hypothetical protein